MFKNGTGGDVEQTYIFLKMVLLFITSEVIIKRKIIFKQKNKNLSRIENYGIRNKFSYLYISISQINNLAFYYFNQNVS